MGEKHASDILLLAFYCQVYPRAVVCHKPFSWIVNGCSDFCSSCNRKDIFRGPPPLSGKQAGKNTSYLGSCVRCAECFCHGQGLQCVLVSYHPLLDDYSTYNWKSNGCHLLTCHKEASYITWGVSVPTLCVIGSLSTTSTLQASFTGGMWNCRSPSCR